VLFRSFVAEKDRFPKLYATFFLSFSAVSKTETKVSIERNCIKTYIASTASTPYASSFDAMLYRDGQLGISTRYTLQLNSASILKGFDFGCINIWFCLNFLDVVISSRNTRKYKTLCIKVDIHVCTVCIHQRVTWSSRVLNKIRVQMSANHWGSVF